MKNAPTAWKRFRYPETLFRAGGFLAVLLFVLCSVDVMDIRLERFVNLFQHFGTALATRYCPPDFAHVYGKSFLWSMLESFSMATLGCAAGLTAAVPLAWWASRNLSPSKRILYPLARFAVMGCRSVHETVWTLLFVAIIGFGQFAGVIALCLFTIGFAGKLMTEEIEGVDNRQADAIRAAGGNNLQIFVLAVLPQVRTGWTGIAIYSWDVAFRAATIIGYFGAGGMGFHLRRYVDQLQTQRVAAVLLGILGIVCVFEILSAKARNAVARSGGDVEEAPKRRMT